jgi:hypothetical protein
VSLFDTADGTPVVSFVNVHRLAQSYAEKQTTVQKYRPRAEIWTARGHLFCRAMVTLGGAELTSLCRPMEEI